MQFRSGGLNGKNLGDLHIGKPALKFFSNLSKKLNVHLMVQEAVHLQNVSGFYLAVLAYPVL